MNLKKWIPVKVELSPTCHIVGITDCKLDKFQRFYIIHNSGTCSCYPENCCFKLTDEEKLKIKYDLQTH